MKLFLYNIFYSKANNKVKWYFFIDDYFISSLILINLLTIILESFVAISLKYSSLFRFIELFSVLIFSTEYIVRFWVSDLHYSTLSPSKARIKYMFSFYGIIDLIAIVPFYLPLLIPLVFNIDLRFLRTFRLLRLFRMFKLANYSESLQLLINVFKEKKNDLLTTFVVTFIILIITSTLMYELEHTVQPDKFPNVFATLWWAVATLTTIGYGDVFPITALGKILAGVTAILGIGLVAIPTGILSSGFVEAINKKRNTENRLNSNCKEEDNICKEECNHEQYVCPKCGTHLIKNNSDEFQIK